MRKKPSGNWEIEIRDRRLKGGRLAISARTPSVTTARRREAVIRAAMDTGALDLVERLRAKGDERLHIADLQAAADRGDLASLRQTEPQPAPEPLTLGSQVDRLMQTVRATREPGTARLYELTCAMLVEKFGADTPIAQITSDALENWLHEPKATANGRPWSSAKQRMTAGLVGRLFNFVIRKEGELADRLGTTPRVRRNPIKNVELPKDGGKRIEYLQPPEWRTLIATAEDRAVAALLAVGCLAGLRIMEAAHLRMDVDVAGLGTDDPVLHIQPRKGKHAWQPKTRRSIRVVPVCDELHQVLLRHVELGFAGDRYLIRVPGRDEPLSGEGLRRWTERAFVAAGIAYGRKKDALTYHSLRHTFISWMVQGDVSLKKIETVAGTSVRMIIEVYGHLIDEDLRRAVNVVGARAKEER